MAKIKVIYTNKGCEDFRIFSDHEEYETWLSMAYNDIKDKTLIIKDVSTI